MKAEPDALELVVDGFADVIDHVHAHVGVGDFAEEANDQHEEDEPRQTEENGAEVAGRGVGSGDPLAEAGGDGRFGLAYFLDGVDALAGLADGEGFGSGDGGDPHAGEEHGGDHRADEAEHPAEQDPVGNLRGFA